VRRDGNVLGVRNFRKLTPEETAGVFQDPRKLKAVKDEAKSQCKGGFALLATHSANRRTVRFSSGGRQ
jgi:hypothetical protein